jgi:hypothetical protein
MSRNDIEQHKVMFGDGSKFGDPESVDIVSGDPEMSEFKRQARRHQSEWREARGLKPGKQPMRPKDDHWRFIGSRLDIQDAYALGSNFITPAARAAADGRMANPEPHQTLNADRLYSDLLSSMPMCFNLFGPLHADLELADCAVHSWWPGTPGKVRAVRFEWSPGRRVAGKYLGNRSAFDVAFELDLGEGRSGIIGVETKYHEHCKPERAPNREKSMPRYAEVTHKSGVFASNALVRIVGTKLQQIWLDHLLALSMPITDPNSWAWVKFVLVHPAFNLSYAKAAEEYRSLLIDESTFDVVTIESLLDSSVIPFDSKKAFRERYLW